MINKELSNNQNLYSWLIISILLACFFINYGNSLLTKNKYLQEQNTKKFGRIITIITILLIFQTEEKIKNIAERRLINSIIIFISTISYLTYIIKLDKIE